MVEIEALKMIDEEYCRYGLPVDEFLHSYRVAQACLKIGFALNLEEKTLAELFASAIFHDIGKARVDKSVLGKKGRLNAYERKKVQMHPIYSAEYIQRIPELKKLSKVVRAHHERWDGKGYPDKLTKEQIPYLARIISIADVYDALKYPRIYRPYSFSNEEIKEIMTKSSGIEFDPQILPVFIRLL